MHRVCAQTVVEIFAQFPLGNGVFQIDLRGGQDPNIHLDAVLAALPHKISIPQNVQQFGLQAQRHFGDVIQQQRAALAEFEFARLGVSVLRLPNSSLSSTSPGKVAQLILRKRNPDRTESL